MRQHGLLLGIVAVVFGLVGFAMSAIILGQKAGPAPKRFAIPIDASGKSWVRFAAYDSAGIAAFAQPQWFNPPNK